MPATLAHALTWLLALVICGLNLGYWHIVIRRREDRFRAWVERTFGVSITRGPRGHWNVSSDRSWLYNLGVELLEFVYFMGAFVVWAIGLGVCVALLSQLPD